MALVQIPTPVVATGDNWTLVNTGGTALTSATTVTVSGITSNKIMIHVANASSVNMSSTVRIRFNADSTSKYSQVGGTATYLSPYSNNVFVPISVDITEGDGIELGKMSQEASAYVSGYLLVTGANNSNPKIYSGAGAGSSASAQSQNIQYNFGGVYTGTSAITSVSILSSTGNFDAGRVYIYGA